MNSIERFYATVERRPVDRPAAWLGIPDTNSLAGLFKEFGVNTLHELKLAIGDDFYSVDVPFHSESSDAIYAAFDWYQSGSLDTEHRTLSADGCFVNCESPEEILSFAWPDTELCVSAEECDRKIAQCPPDKAIIGVLWAAHFQDTCASFGMETALVNMLTNPELYEAVNERVLAFYLKAAEIFYKSARGRVHAVLIGNDMGSQRGLMLSPELIRRFVLPGCRRLVEQAHSYGIKVIYHSCGSIREIIPDLIECGVDVIHPIQALAAGMDADSMKASFGAKVSFCGGVDTQELLVHGSPEEVARRVDELRRLFPTGLILSPSHEAILPDVPPANIRALFTAATKQKISIVYTGTTPQLIECVESELTKQLGDNIQTQSYSDPGLLDTVREAGYVTAEAAERLLGHYWRAVNEGASIILNACSSVGEIASASRELFKLIGVKIIRIDELMACEAIKMGSKIAVIATLPTTLNPTCTLLQRCAAEKGKAIEIHEKLVEVFGMNSDEFAAALTEAGRGCADADVILLAQGSMAWCEAQIAKAAGKTVLSSPRFGAAAVADAIFNC